MSSSASKVRPFILCVRVFYSKLLFFNIKDQHVTLSLFVVSAKSPNVCGRCWRQYPLCLPPDRPTDLAVVPVGVIRNETIWRLLQTENGLEYDDSSGCKTAVFLVLTPCKLADKFLRHFSVNLPNYTVPRQKKKNNFVSLAVRTNKM